MPRLRPAAFALAFLSAAASVGAQSFPTNDPVIRRLWDEGMTSKSQVARLAQVLTDSIGPRLSGSPAFLGATDWVSARYAEWGIPARKERYGTWRGWRRRYTHIDLIAPRERTLEGMILAWSPGTTKPVEGDVVVIPELADSNAVKAWLPSVKGKFVLLSAPEPTCRPDENWERLARPASVLAMKAARDSSKRAWNQRAQRLGPNAFALLDGSGAAGIVTSLWSAGWGVNKVFSASTRTVPVMDVSCEDYGLLHRLAANNQGPRLRLDARAEQLPESPMFNVVAELKGTEKPDEYVLLGAHLDSWDGASGATDNGTGTVMMMEAMRLLKAAYPNPKRTILVGHWGAEEQGLIGSRAFAEDHKEVVDGLQAAFNQDNGTWRVEYIRMMGLTGAASHFGRWLSVIPTEIEGLIDLDIPGVPETGGSDHMSFLCAGAPSFRLQSNYPDYRQYTWHTNRDTYDKVIIDDLKNNATLAAMLAYQASEDPERVARDKRVMTTPSGTTTPWPRCSTPPRSTPQR
ncbi:MAG: M20/M25/M40 family metallo-hydrolase [Gemmatimonadetes bacterium]|nr:M20/M25/M40 family metallo-hydrolase [Gemmatimonadota bacterium]MBK8647791.1 M20/M25/M40 family metallo-hydrolase [Gemmatimonadota bacterium]